MIDTVTEAFQVDNDLDETGQYPAFTFSIISVKILGTSESKLVRILKMHHGLLFVR
jgi:hypothetical protein